MITRRKFVQTSLAASAVALTGCGNEPQKAPTPANPPAAAAADAELKVYFVGGTVFVPEGKTLLALQLSGKGQKYHGHSLEHASYIAGLGFPGPALPASLIASRPAFNGFATDCLVGKAITVTGKNNGANANGGTKLADYKKLAKDWKRKGEWDPAKNEAINSMFTFIDGDLGNDKAMNQTAAAVEWWIKDKADKKELSDVAVVTVKAPVITISGLTKDDIVVKPEFPRALAVFSGPLELHPKGYKYTKISHALLLKTIYEVSGTPDDDIMPTTEKEVLGEYGEPMDNPCTKTKPQKVFVPPDSEYLSELRRNSVGGAVKARRHGLAMPPVRPSKAFSRGTRDLRCSLEQSALESGKREAAMSWGQDVRYSARILAKHRGFSAVAILTLAIAIGASTALFSVIDAALLHPIPYPHPEQLVDLSVEEIGNGPARTLGPSLAEAREWWASSGAFSHVCVSRTGRRAVVDTGEIERAVTSEFTEGCLPMYGVTPIRGRGITLADTAAEAPAVVLLGYRYWQSRFGGAEDVLGRTIRLPDGPATIVGVLPAGFERKTALVKALRVAYQFPGAEQRRGLGTSTYARLAPGVTAAQAEARSAAVMNTATARLKTESLYDDTTAGYATTIRTLAGAVGLIFCWRASTSPACCWRGVPRASPSWPCASRSAPVERESCGSC